MGNINKKFPIVICLFIILVVAVLLFFPKVSKPKEEQVSAKEYIFRFLLDKHWKNESQNTNVVFKSKDMEKLEIIEDGEKNSMLYSYDEKSKGNSFIFTNNKSTCRIEIEGKSTIIYQFASNIEGNGGLSVPIKLTSK
ncbi:hypothetical protein [Candidatus Enterococcus lemimoniae]|uniref:Uncharacterized protein n=1 Tax=Candidatus Enterococcus lemimoniae TaxID=1834167 RepID=A0ABZ2T4K8_9ENTE|nr:hypothetical protein [Enterococcus sp. 12C11_DIV0727]OTO68460.1 hypothetical protein A5866_000658 [Enterococcus sp. 12C11_DIV0727]